MATISLKDKGTQLYKKQQYQQAADCYSQYVRTQHKDNKNAYFNLALCLFKLKKYHQCIQACNQALDLDPQYSKVYYRLFQAYKQVKDNYNTFISGANFIKHCTEEQQIKKIVSIIKECKQKVSFETKTKSEEIKKLLNEVSIFIQKTSQEQMQNTQIQKQKSKLKIQKNQNDSQVTLQQKWKLIQLQITQDIQYGTNIAHQFIRKLDSQHKPKYLKLLKNLRKKLKQLPIGFQQSKESNEKQEKTIQKEQKGQNQQQGQNQQIISVKTTNQQESQTHFIQKNSYIQLKSPKQNYSMTTQKQHMALGIQKNKNDQNCDNQDNLIDEKQIFGLYQQYIENPLKQQTDIFETFKKQIHLIIDSPNLDRISKRQLLIMTSKRLKKFSFIMKSYTGKQKLQIESSLRKEKLDRVVPYYFKK